MIEKIVFLTVRRVHDMACAINLDRNGNRVLDAFQSIIVSRNAAHPLACPAERFHDVQHAVAEASVRQPVRQIGHRSAIPKGDDHAFARSKLRPQS